METWLQLFWTLEILFKTGFTVQWYYTIIGLIRTGNIRMKGKVKPLRKVCWFG
jgi:hypothetical protein